MGRYDAQVAREQDTTYAGAGIFSNAATTEDVRTLTQRSDELANMLESVASRIERLTERLGAKGGECALARDSAPRPSRLLRDSIGDGHRATNRIHEAIEFIENTL